MPSTRSARHAVALAALATALASCIDPAEPSRYHGADHEFSWEEDDVQAERMNGIIYVQPPPAKYGERQSSGSHH